jgi:hypothetical protein
LQLRSQEVLPPDDFGTQHFKLARDFRQLLILRLIVGDRFLKELDLLRPKIEGGSKLGDVFVVRNPYLLLLDWRIGRCHRRRRRLGGRLLRAGFVQAEARH